MTQEQFNRKLDERLKQIAAANFLLPCVTDAHASQVKRIFTEGINGNGARIGTYDNSNPIYINPNQSPKKFPLKGKNGETTFKSGKSHKTGYFDSYKAFRQAISRETNFVNLRLTEDLKFDFTNSLTLNGNTYQTGVKRNSEKVEGIIKKYGDETFKLTIQERNNFIECVKTKINATLAN